MEKEVLQVLEENKEIKQADKPYVREGEELEEYKLHRRFDRMGRLVGDQKMKSLMDSHVMIFGLGGVGSWAAESMVRAGIGKVTLIDFDDICITNSNRQLHALKGLVGKSKAEVMAERMQKINPKVEARGLALFYSKENCEEIFAERPDFVIDAIDNITSKCHLIAHCHKEKIPLVVSTGASGKLDPTQIQIVDLAKTSVDPLARDLRRILRERYGFSKKGDFGIPAVFSREHVRFPKDLSYDKGKGFQCVCPQRDNNMHSCDNRSIIYGTAGFVTGSFGFACASVALRTLVGEDVL